MRSIIILFCLSLHVWGSLSSTVTWEVRPTNGSDSNGGCFDGGVSSPGTDYTQQNAVQYSFTDLASSNGTTNPSSVTSASHSFASADVGDCIHISAGTSWTTGWYEITSVSGGAATVDRAVGTSASLSGGTWLEGGALKTLGQLGTNFAAGNVGWVKAESTIGVTSAVTIGGNQNRITTVIGYSSTRGDGGQVTVQAQSGLSNAFVLTLDQSIVIENFVIDANNIGPTSGTSGLSTGNGGGAVNVIVKNKNWNTNAALSLGTSAFCEQCYVTNVSGGEAVSIASGGILSDSVIYGNSVPGVIATYNSSNPTVLLNVIIANNTGSSSDGIQIGSSVGSIILQHVVCYKNGRDGLRWAPQTGGTSSILVSNSVFYGNSEYGINVTTSMTMSTYFNWNAYGNNTTANLSGLAAGANDVTLSSDPFVNGSSENFALSSSGITALAAKGFPGALSTGGTGFTDIGALQHQATGGGQKGFPIVQ